MTTPDISRHSEAWLEQLRRRFVSVARRRVPEAFVEDLVQEALSIVYSRGMAGGRGRNVDGMPALAWCFQVLRNTIGNFYQRQRTRAQEPDADEQPLAAPTPTPLEALESDERGRAIRAALEAMRSADPQCARYVERVAAGSKPSSLAADEGVDAAVFYRRLYRCRVKLRSLLESRGVIT